jgi:flagellar motor switch protein FliN/FliY
MPTPAPTPSQDDRLSIVLDVKVQLTVRLGSCQLPMREVLELSPGAVIQLNQRASDAVGLYVNDKLIALGEVVVLDENFGIKITELVGDKA